MTNSTERRSSPRVRAILTAVAMGLFALVVSGVFGSWPIGVLMGTAVMVGSLTPPFSSWPRKT